MNKKISQYIPRTIGLPEIPKTDSIFVKDGARDSEVTRKTTEQRLAEIETLLKPFQNFDSNQLKEMYDEYARRQLGIIDDGTYTTGIGATTNGTITIKNGIITSITEAVT